jgi:hypothetical protein
LTASTLRQVDCVAILTDHRTFDFDALIASAPLIIDTRNAIKSRHPHVFRLGAPKPAGRAAAAGEPLAAVAHEAIDS